MRTQRPITVVNSFSHGICNFQCSLCSVGKAGYDGPRLFQPYEVTAKLIERVQEAAHAGRRIRRVDNSGVGEPTLHPEFRERIEMFGDMIRDWNAPVPAPQMALVTNGTRLAEPDVLAALRDNPTRLQVSFPTPVPEGYGTIMLGDATQGGPMLKKVTAGIRKAMELMAQGKLEELFFHISPPERDIVRRDFPTTVDFLTRLADEARLEHIWVVMFPATFSRLGLVDNPVSRVDTYRDLFRRYHGERLNGVRLLMTSALQQFYPSLWEIVDLLRAFDYPCLPNGNLFIGADGSSICPNDQAVHNPFGNLMLNDIETLMRIKETYLPNRECAQCETAPHRMHGPMLVRLFSAAAKLRIKSARRLGGSRPSLPASAEWQWPGLVQDSRPPGGQS